MQTRRRKWLIVAMVPVLTFVSVGVYSLLPPKPGVTLQNFQRLHHDMSREQIEAILGSRGKLFRVMTGNIGYRWQGSEGTIEISFSGERAMYAVFWSKGARENGKKEPDLARDFDWSQSDLEAILDRVKEWTGW